MNNDVQIVDVIESFKKQIAEMAYQIAFRDGTIESLERRIEELEKEAEEAGRREPVVAVEK